MVLKRLTGNGNIKTCTVYHALMALCLMVSMGCESALPLLDPILLRPWGPPKKTPANLGLKFEDVRIPTAGGNHLSAWFIPAQQKKARATFLVHTGMEGNIARFLIITAWAANDDINMLIYDWQGFGASEGEPHYSNFDNDTRGALSYLLSRSEPSCRKVIHLGISLGTLPAVAIAAENLDTTIGLALYGPFFPNELPGIWLSDHALPVFVPLGDVSGILWTAMLPENMKPWNYWDRLTMPKIVITPVDDEVIPTEQQVRFFNALPDPKTQYFTYGGHTRAPERDPDLGTHVMDWAHRLPGLLPAE